MSYTCPACGVHEIPNHTVKDYVDEFRCNSCNQMMGEPLQSLIQSKGGLKAYHKEVDRLRREDATAKRETEKMERQQKLQAENIRLAPVRTVRMFKHAIVK